MRILAHLDDVGSTQGSVVAWQALRKADVVRSASLMVPCPWYPLARDDWLETPDQDMGVHITLTSEWSSYRWRPLSGSGGGLVDMEGFMHRRPAAVLATADPNAVADEIAAQIERALQDGIKPTHLDAHMGTALLNPFVWKLIEAGKRYGIPALVCRNLQPLLSDVSAPAPDQGFLDEVVTEAVAQKWPVFDQFVIGFCADKTPIEDHVRELIVEAGTGLSYYGLHADTAVGMDAFAPNHSMPRYKEYELFSSSRSRALFEKTGATLVNWGEV